MQTEKTIERNREFSLGDRSVRLRAVFLWVAEFDDVHEIVKKWFDGNSDEKRYNLLVDDLVKAGKVDPESAAKIIQFIRGVDATVRLCHFPYGSNTLAIQSIHSINKPRVNPVEITPAELVETETPTSAAEASPPVAEPAAGTNGDSEADLWWPTKKMEDVFGVDATALRLLAKNGIVESKRIGKLYYFRVVSFRKFMQSR